MKNRVRNLRIVGISEGISFLVLLLIAMPIKYVLGVPEVVKVVGWAHGILFILYIAVVFMAVKPMQWTFLKTIIALAASLIPFGTFLLDKSWKERERSLASEK